MKSHKVQVEDLGKWMEEQEIMFASSFGKQSSKKLMVGLNGFYKVYNEGKIVMHTMSPGKAVNEYNKLP